MYNIIHELSWRGLIHNITPNLNEVLKNRHITLYIGFDPTYDSLHIGNLLALIILIHFINAGHTPIVVIGGATGMIGDPSYKDKERKYIDNNILYKNIESIKNQIKSIINNIEILDNYLWTNNIKIIDFLQNIGKYITVNYMTSKDSVKHRLYKNTKYGMSFLEFSYQIFQGYDFLYLYEKRECILQIGGSDQWGNITTGIDLIRKKIGKTAYGLTFPLTTNSKGIKLGKSDNYNNNIWLNYRYTSAYNFFQFWLNISDNDAELYIKKYTFISKYIIDCLIKKHKENPSKRFLQKKLAEELTKIVHGTKKYQKVLNISKLLFNNYNFLENIGFIEYQDLFDEIPNIIINREELSKEYSITDILVKKFKIYSSNKEVYRKLKERSIMINKKHIDYKFCLSKKYFIMNKFSLLQIGKKHFYIIIIN